MSGKTTLLWFSVIPYRPWRYLHRLSFSLLFGSKSSLALIFGSSTILFLPSSSSQMIQKTKALQGGKGQQDEPAEMDQTL